jgi:hypothetical protein
MKQLLQFITIAFLLAAAGDALAQTAGFTMSASSGCAPQLIQFTNTSTGSITAYAWNFGNGATSVLKDPSTTNTSASVRNDSPIIALCESGERLTLKEDITLMR